MEQLNHFTEKQWEAYCLDVLPESDRTSMEEHLYSCDLCLNKYLEIAEQGLHDSDYEPSEKFLQEFSKAYSQPPVVTLNLKKIKRTIITYYIAAACITLLLTFSGVFNKTVEIASKVDEHKQIINIKQDWSQGVIDKTSGLLDQIIRK